MVTPQVTPRWAVPALGRGALLTPVSSLHTGCSTGPGAWSRRSMA